jgi:hypothetical protein
MILLICGYTDFITLDIVPYTRLHRSRYLQARYREGTGTVALRSSVQLGTHSPAGFCVKALFCFPPISAKLHLQF